MKSMINNEIDCESLLDSADVKGTCIRYISPEVGIDGNPDGRNEMYHSFALLPQQTHSLNVGVEENRDDILHETDALITLKSDLPIGVLTAEPTLSTSFTVH